MKNKTGKTDSKTKKFACLRTLPQQARIPASWSENLFRDEFLTAKMPNGF
jgi:hypothetical protein